MSGRTDDTESERRRERKTEKGRERERGEAKLQTDKTIVTGTIINDLKEESSRINDLKGAIQRRIL